MTRQTNGTPELKYSEETFRDMYEALKTLLPYAEGNPVVYKGDILKAQQALTLAEGKRHIQEDFIKHLNCYSYPRNADMIIEEVELKETEVKSTDTDPRV